MPTLLGRILAGLPVVAVAARRSAGAIGATPKQ
jgi:hypothetical protein